MTTMRFMLTGAEGDYRLALYDQRQFATVAVGREVRHMRPGDTWTIAADQDVPMIGIRPFQTDTLDPERFAWRLAPAEAVKVTRR